MKKEYESLFTPWKIGNLEIKNRIVQTSMGGTSIFGWMELHHFDKEAAKFLLERAQNNVGLILPGIAPIRNVIGGAWLYKSKKAFAELKKFMVEYHKTGAKLFVQLTAGFGRAFAITHLIEMLKTNKVLGAMAKPAINVDQLTMSASENPNRWSDKVPSRAMTVKEIEKMIYAFGQTAKMCMEAGVDGVEIHAVHEGYLIDQFATKYTNHRTDQYGGSLENRYRFPAEIVKEIKKVCGKEYPVSLRYSVQSKVKDFREGILPGEDYQDIGRDMEESVLAAKYLEEAGYDMFNADNGTYDSWYWAHPPMYMPQNCNLDDCSAIKKVLNVPVVCAGKMDAGVGAKAVADGAIDAVGFARQFLADPQWVTKLMEDREGDILPCINCHNACFTMASYKGVANDQPLSDSSGMSRCAINPQTMQSKKYFIKPAKKVKKIAVVGGGIGGMEVDRVASLRGHKVTIFEKSHELGGVFIAAAAPSFKEKDRELIAYLIKQITDLGVEVKFDTPVDENTSFAEFDKVVVATGSTARKLRLPGFDKAIEACDYLRGKKQVGDKVIVIGGGLSGCEIAYDLYLQGKTPVIIEMRNDLMIGAGICLANSSFLRDFFAHNNVEVHLETGLNEITDTGVIVTDKQGNKFEIAGDNVVVSVGYISTPQQTSAKAQLVGDCLKVGNLRTVMWKAWDVAMKL